MHRLATDIKAVLTASFRGPNARLDECRRALREQARVRIGGAGGGRWTRARLEQVIRPHDGYIASSPERDARSTDQRTAIDGSCPSGSRHLARISRIMQHAEKASLHKTRMLFLIPHGFRPDSPL